MELYRDPANRFVAGFIGSPAMSFLEDRVGNGGVSFAYLDSVNGERVVVEERGDERAAAGDTVGLAFEARNLRIFDAGPGLRIR